MIVSSIADGAGVDGISGIFNVDAFSVAVIAAALTLADIFGVKLKFRCVPMHGVDLKLNEIQ